MERRGGRRGGGGDRNGSDYRSARSDRSGGGGAAFIRGGDGGRLKPMPDLDEIEATKKKFTGRCRLFVGNMPPDMSEEELKKLFEEFGEVAECYMSGKGFAFIRLDTRAHAEAAKESLDNTNIRNRSLRVRFAVHGASLRVKELSPYVSNELLFQAFSQFGEVERAVHIVDEKGRPVGEGIVEFARKGGALETMNRVGAGVFLLTSDPRPVTVEFMEARDEEDGLSERMCQKNAQYQRERELRPRFPPERSFEHEYGLKWKELYALEKAKKEELENEFIQARQRLEAEMDLAYQDYQTAQLREDLRRRQEELERLEASKRERMEMFGGRGGGGPQGFGGGFGGGRSEAAGFGGPRGFGGMEPESGGPPPGFRNTFDGPKGFGAPPDVFGSPQPGGFPPNDPMGGGYGMEDPSMGRSSEVNQLMSLFNKGGGAPPVEDDASFNLGFGNGGPRGFGDAGDEGRGGRDFGRREGGGGFGGFGGRGGGRRSGGGSGPDYAPPKRRR